MSSKEDLNIPQLQRKARRATRAAVVFSFLLALFWSVDAFFIWLFLGAIVYCLFLVWFYNRQTKPDTNGDMQSPLFASSPSAAVPEILKNRAKIFLPVLLGMMILAIVIKMSVSSSSGEEETPAETNESENRAEQSGLNNAEHIDSLTNKGNDLYNQGKYDAALNYYNEVLALDPGNQYALYDKALVYYSKKESNRTVPILLDCIRQHPDYGDALWLLGDVYYDRNNLDSAKICFDRAYQSGLRKGNFLELMASAYERQDRSKAIELYKESLEQDSTLIGCYRKLAELDPSHSEKYMKMMARWNKSN